MIYTENNLIYKKIYYIIMEATYDEFSIYTTPEEIINFVDDLIINNGLTCDFEIYDKCREYFGEYFNYNLDDIYR